jgi:negative regulator of replication initiation
MWALAHAGAGFQHQIMGNRRVLSVLWDLKDQSEAEAVEILEGRIRQAQSAQEESLKVTGVRLKVE